MVEPARLIINPNLWDDKAEQVKSKIVCDDEMCSYQPANSSPTSKKPINPDRQRTAERVVGRDTGTILQSAKVQCRNDHGRNSQTNIDRIVRIVRRVSRKAPPFRCSQKELSDHQTRITAV